MPSWVVGEVSASLMRILLEDWASLDANCGSKSSSVQNTEGPYIASSYNVPGNCKAKNFMYLNINSYY